MEIDVIDYDRAVCKKEHIMTDDELRALVASLAVNQKETARQMKETDERLNQRFKETDERLNKRFEETDERLNKRYEETDKRLEETDKRLNKRFEKTDKQIKELGRQIGGLGNKFGGFTEGMALPSMTRILTERFGMEVVSPRVKARKGIEQMEIDVLAYANSDVNIVFVVEIKSRLQERDLVQMNAILEKFPRMFPEHSDKRLYGMIAAVDMSEVDKENVLQNGWYLAAINDEQFEIQTPPGFKAKQYNVEAA